MALKLTSKIKGMTKDWYVKVIHCKAENKGLSTATYGYFTDVESAKDRLNAVELQNISFNAVPDVDIFKQAYSAMSGIEEFKDAENC